jgi:hypothetical protein
VVLVYRKMFSWNQIQMMLRAVTFRPPRNN